MSDNIDNIFEFTRPADKILTISPPPINICFTEHDGTCIGKFEYSQETGKWFFEGDMEESARKFIYFLDKIAGEKL